MKSGDILQLTDLCTVDYDWLWCESENCIITYDEVDSFEGQLILVMTREPWVQ